MKKYKLTPYGKMIIGTTIKYLFGTLLCLALYCLMMLELIFIASLFVPIF